MKMSLVVLSAENKFGKVIGCIQKGDNEFKLSILRDNPTFPEAPYMTISAFKGYVENAVAFEHGHYDLKAVDILR